MANKAQTTSTNKKAERRPAKAQRAGKDETAAPRTIDTSGLLASLERIQDELLHATESLLEDEESPACQEVARALERSLRDRGISFYSLHGAEVSQ